MTLYASSASGSSSGEAAGAAQFAAAATGPGAVAGQVYMGATAAPRPNAMLTRAATQSLQDAGGGAVQAATSGPQPIWMTTDEAQSTFYNWTAKQRASFIAKAQLGGLLKPGDGIMEADALWQQLVKESAAFGAQGAQVSPLDILGSYVSSGSALPVTRTTTQRQVDLTDPDTAKGIATSMWQQLLGRDPGQGELSGFAAALAQAEQNNPSVTTTTTSYDAAGNATGSTSTSSGGMTDTGREYLAQQIAEQNPDYGATQAATTYMSALQSAIGSGG